MSLLIEALNIMQRISSGENGEVEYVVIDLGLLKFHSATTANKEAAEATMIDGKVASSGTRRYGAPEQFYGNELTPAADIHALGVIVQECFAGHLPRAWEKIVLRATSSVAERRYQTVRDFIKDVKLRNFKSRAIVTLCLIAGVMGGVIFASKFQTGGGVEEFTNKSSTHLASYDSALGLDGYKWEVSDNPWIVAKGDNFEGGFAVESSGGGGGVNETYIKTKIKGTEKEMMVRYQLYYYKGEFSIEIDGKKAFFNKAIVRDGANEWREAKIPLPEGIREIKLKYRHSGTGYINKFNGVRVVTISFLSRQ